MTELIDFVGQHNGIDIIINENYEIMFELSAAFGTTRYLKINPLIAGLLQVPEYIFYFRGAAAVHQTPEYNATTPVYPTLFLTELEAQNAGLAATPYHHFRVCQNFLQGADPHVYQTSNINALDTRLSIDITSTIPSENKQMVLDGEEIRKMILARFEIGDMIQKTTTRTSDGSITVSENIPVGLEDLTRGNPNTQTVNLHTGDIYVVNCFLETRYLEGKKIVVVDTQFDESGFFYLQLLVTKRIK